MTTTLPFELEINTLDAAKKVYVGIKNPVIGIENNTVSVSQQQWVKTEIDGVVYIDRELVVIDEIPLSVLLAAASERSTVH